MRVVILGVVLAAAGCSPRLYLEDADPETVGPLLGGAWVAPENTWPMQTPPTDLVGEGMAEGQVALDVRGTDQHGDEVSLWQFWGLYTLVDISTMWCGPCQELAMGTEHVYQEFKDDGFMYLTVLHENEAKLEPTLEELEIWSQFPAFAPDPTHTEITAPIIADFKGASGSIQAIRNNTYPVALLIGPDLRVVERIEPATEGRIIEKIEEALGR